MDLWTQFLNILSQIISPNWNDLLQYMPLIFIGLILLSIAALARAWQHNAALNRPRTPAPVTAGPPPPGVHLPGPSPWPFVLPIGLLLIFVSIALPPPGLPLNPILLVLGLAVAAAGATGWYRDATREWRRVELGAHGEADLGAHGALVAGAHVGAVIPATVSSAVQVHETPPGVHLPGPSPWPFFAPIGLMFVFMGLVFGPWLILGGAIMSVIAVAGWFRDAKDEYRQVEEGHLPEPRTRDPAQAFPKRLVPIYLGVAGLTLFLTMLPYLLSFLPGSTGKPQASAGAAVAVTTTPIISASSAVSFDQSEIVVAAGKPLTLTFDNKNAGVPHNVAIYDGPAEARNLFKGEIVTGPKQVIYNVPPLPVGSYYFVCNVHANMHGTVTAK
jgi:plastocyanin